MRTTPSSATAKGQRQRALARRGKPRVPALEDVAHPLLLERSSALMCLHDLAGKLWAVNPAAAKALGYAPEELVGRNLGELIEPELRPELEAHLARIRAQGSDNGLLRVRTREGEPRIWHFSNAVVEKEGLPAFVIGVAQDVTAEHLAQRELRERNVFAGLTADLSAALAHEGSIPELLRPVAHSLMQRLGAEVVVLCVSHGAQRAAHIATRSHTSELTCAVADRFAAAIAAAIAAATAAGVGAADRGRLLAARELATLRETGGVELGASKAAAVVPLLVGARRAGLLLVGSARPQSEPWLTRLYFFVEQLTLGVDRARAKAELAENERRFRLLFEEAPIGVYRTTPDGRITLANQQIVRMLGYRSLEELYARDLEEEGLDALYERQRFKEQLEQQGFVRGLEARWRRRDGSLMWVREHARVVRAVDGTIDYYEGTVEDITERKAAEDALVASEARTRSILENLLEGMVVADLRGVIRSANRSAEALFGLAASQLIGQPLERYLSPSRPGEGAPAVINELIERAGTIVEWKGRRDGDEDFPCAISIVEVPYGRQKQFALAIRDLSSERESERLRRDVLAMVTHDMKTPLTALQGSLALLRTGAFGEVPEKALDILSIADRGVRRLSRMVIDLLDAERLRDGKLPLTLGVAEGRELLERALEAVAEIARQRDITLRLEAAAGEVSCDADRLIQVLVNFLDNAIRHSSAGDVVTLAARADGPWLEFSVTDQGPGISPPERAGLFRRYRRLGKAARRSSTGAGLGLAISKELVELHQGEIGVDEGPAGNGSRFWFRVPREEGALTAGASARPDG